MYHTYSECPKTYLYVQSLLKQDKHGLDSKCKNTVTVLGIYCPSVKVDPKSGQSLSNEFWAALKMSLSWKCLMMGDFFMF